jgi:hypothetical protein
VYELTFSNPRASLGAVYKARRCKLSWLTCEDDVERLVVGRVLSVCATHEHGFECVSVHRGGCRATTDGTRAVAKRRLIGRGRRNAA